MNLNTEPIFENLLRPLTEDEFKQLETNLVRDGCRESIVVWDKRNVILDGHNRYRICTKHNLPFGIVFKKLATEDDVIAWMIENQRGRRNLTEDQERRLRGRRYKEEKKAPGDGKNQYTQSASDQNEQRQTAERLAAEYGVSPATIRRDAAFDSECEKAGVPLSEMGPESTSEVKAKVEEAKGKANGTHKREPSRAKLVQAAADALPQDFKDAIAAVYPPNYRSPYARGHVGLPADFRAEAERMICAGTRVSCSADGKIDLRQFVPKLCDSAWEYLKKHECEDLAIWRRIEAFQPILQRTMAERQIMGEPVDQDENVIWRTRRNGWLPVEPSTTWAAMCGTDAEGKDIYLVLREIMSCHDCSVKNGELWNSEPFWHRRKAFLMGLGKVIAEGRIKNPSRWSGALHAVANTRIPSDADYKKATP